MPMIQLTAPDTEFLRAQAWSYLRELPAGAQVTAAVLAAAQGVRADA